MKFENFYWNGKTFLIFITNGSIKLSEDKTQVVKENSDLFNWNFKCIEDTTIASSKDNYKTSDEAIIGAIAYIMSNY